MITNMQLGRAFLSDTFGAHPTTGMQLDPFGHSATNAKLFQEFGLDSMFFARVNLEQYEEL